MFIRADPATAWMAQAACRHPDEAWKFYEDSLIGSKADQRAKEVCSTCPVSTDCLQYALTMFSSAWGVWGGTNESDRARLRRRKT